MGLTSAVSSGDRRAALEALRDRLADEVEREIEQGYCHTCKRGSSSLAPVSKQLRDVLAELAELSPGVRKDSARDELERRRRAREAGAG